MSAPSTIASPSSSLSPPAPALTTPYIFPTSCSNSYALTSSNTNYQSFASLSEAYLYVDTTQPQYQSCQPPGRTPITSHFNATAYTSAVCPSGWTAWNVGLQSKYITTSTSSTWSTALCCGHGHKLVDDIWSVYGNDYNGKACIETFLTTGEGGEKQVFTTATSNSSYPFFIEVAQATTLTLSPSALFEPPSTIRSTGTTRVFSTATLIPAVTTFSGRAFYPPWSIHWEESDNETLDPTWPRLTNDMLLPSWVPGEKVEDGVWENRGAGQGPTRNEGYEKAWALPVMVVLGALLALTLLALGFLGWRMRKLKRERNRRWDIKDEDGMVSNGHGNETADGKGNIKRVPVGGHARKVSVSNGERARVVDVRRSRRSNPLQDGEAP